MQADLLNLLNEQKINDELGLKYKELHKIYHLIYLYLGINDWDFITIKKINNIELKCYILDEESEIIGTEKLDIDVKLKLHKVFYENIKIR